MGKRFTEILGSCELFQYLRLYSKPFRPPKMWDSRRKGTESPVVMRDWVRVEFNFFQPPPPCVIDKQIFTPPPP